MSCVHRFRLAPFFCLVLSVLTTTTEAAEPPNIIYILADDLGYGDLSCYGQTKLATPHIDRLAASGVLFEQAYGPAPLCSPSRTSIMTGLRPSTTGIAAQSRRSPSPPSRPKSSGEARHGASIPPARP